MKASELRIGNMVWRVYKNASPLHVNKDIEVVQSIPDKKIYGELPSSYCDPIPLTEEWLVKIGCKLETDSAPAIGDYSYWTVNNKFEINNDPGGWFVIELSISHRFKFVHQLQNLYFALTGKELEIKNQ